MIPLWKELEFYMEYQAKLRAYLGIEKANEIIGEALYLMSLGTNDFLENYYILPTRRVHFTVSQYQDFLLGIAENFIKELYALGARKLSITGLIPMGCLPLERATNILGDHGCNEEYNDVALGFNKKLEKLISKLNRELPLLTAVSANAFDIVSDIITRPSSYGMLFLIYTLLSALTYVICFNFCVRMIMVLFLFYVANFFLNSTMA